MYSLHETKMALLRQDDHNADTRAQRIEEMADELYEAKLATLSGGTLGGSDYQSRQGYNILSVLNELDNIDLIPFANAITANDVTLTGTLIIKLVLAELRKDALKEADDYDELILTKENTVQNEHEILAAK